MTTSIWLSGLLALAGFGVADAPILPDPVNDEAGELSSVDEERLAASLVALREKTGVQMAILVVKSLPSGVPIEEFSIATAERWGGGSKERDDGLLLTLAMSDRKSRLEVGYGLEGWIPDAKAGRILGDMKPALREGRTADALALAIDRVSEAVADIKPGEGLPLGGRVLGGVYRVVDLLPHGLVPIGLLLGFLVMVAFRKPVKKSPVKKLSKRLHPRRNPLRVALIAFPLVELAVYLTRFDGGPAVLVAVYTAAAAGFGAVLGLAETRAKLIVAFIVALVPVGLFAAAAGLSLPGDNVAALLGFGGFGGIMAVAFLSLEGGAGSAGGGSGGGWSSSSSSSSSSWSSSSSSSSSSSDWSGGGGGFGGGGSSSDW